MTDASSITTLRPRYDGVVRIVLPDNNLYFSNFDAGESPAEGTACAGASVHSDGNDGLFSNLGNDWIVGGTGKDHVFGRWGDDLIDRRWVAWTC